MSPFKKFKKRIRLAINLTIYRLTDWGAEKNVEIEEKTLVIVKNDFIGDYVLFRNVLPYIRQSEKYKDYKIILIGNITWKNLAETLDAQYYDEMIWVAYDKLFKNFRYRSRTIKSLLSRGFDTLFYPVYTGEYYTETFLISKIKANKKIKITPLPLEDLKEEHIFNAMIHTPHENMFEVYRYKEIVELFLGISIPNFEWRSLSSDAYTSQAVTEKPYVVFFPGSSAYLKRWHTSNFVKVAKHLIKQHNYTIVLTGARKDTKYAKAIIAGLEKQYRKQMIDCTGKTSLLDLASLIKHSDLLVTNDSVSIHMAAAQAKEAVCVFMGENYGRFIPYPKEVYSKGIFICPPSVKAMVNDNEETRTYLSLDYNPKIDEISPEAVIDAVEIILRRKNKNAFVE
ncbi:MAG: glycosyltransferase family 9 protein [Cytophagaceae bacterium]|nr:glycosyltransferase family 9 protein [Cytophagaceae bacterium]